MKSRRFKKFKTYPFNFENDEKPAILCMEADFQSDFLNTQTSFQKSKFGKWKMDPFPERESVLILKIGEK